MKLARTKKLVLLACFGGLLTTPELASAAPKRLSLSDVIGKVRNNPAARAADAERDAMRAQAAEARGARWPRIQMTTFLAPSPEINCDNPECTTTSPVDFAPNIQGVFAGARLEVFQPLYTFGKLDAAASAGDSAVAMQSALAERVKGDLVVDATRAYFGVAFARDLVAMLDDGAKQIAKGKATLVERLKSGDDEVTVQDRLRLEAFETEVVLRLSEAREREATALEGLRALCADREVDIADTTLVAAEKELGTPEGHWQAAESKSPELGAARHGVAALQQREALERARWWPDLLVMGGATIARAQGVDDPPSAFANDPFNATRAELALVLRWSIEPAMQAARVDRTSAERTRGQELAKGARLAVEFAVRDAYNRAHEAGARLDAARQGEKSARGWVASVLQADAVGTASARDLADAYLAYFTLHSRVLQSAYEWNVALAALARASGELTPQSEVP
ncbi:MAG TPA: TolC family protein [Polyangiaceae bacterium]|nr:TolC family protein [Polyangiaceae bacterium]